MHTPTNLTLTKNTEIQAITGSDEVEVLGPIKDIPGLTRLVMVDNNIFPGVISELPLDGNTLVTGTNAAGKTSIIQLLTLFWGVSPNKISRKSQGKSFYQHYLPNLTSYVAFEYRHRDGLPRTVIIHAAPNDDKPMFRFVRSPLYEDMFVDDDNQFVEAPSLATHLRTRGYDVADRIIETLTDYKTIIHGLKPAGSRSKDQRFLAQMVAKYTMSQAGAPLYSADSVVFAMLKKDASLQALESMIADKLLADETNVKIGGNSKDLEQWPNRFKDYTEVMREESNVRTLQAKCVELSGAESTVLAAVGEMITLFDELEEELRAAKESQATATDHLQREKEVYDEAKDTAHTATNDAQQAVIVVENEIDRIEGADQDKRNSGILAKVELANRSDDITADYKRNSERYNALAGEQSELSKKYENFKIEAQTYAAKQTEVARKAEETVREENAADSEQMRARHKSAVDAINDAHESSIAGAEDALNIAISTQGAAEEADKSPSIPQGLLDRQADAQRAYNEKQGELAASLRSASVFETAVRDATNNISDIEREVSRLNKELEGEVALKDRLLISKKPKAGSLLAFLRDQLPDWGDNVGRVINPELLDRMDLSPSLAPDTSSLYGLKIDTSDVNPTAEADLSDINAQIEQVEAEIIELNRQISTSESRLQVAGAALSDAQTNLTQHQGQQSILETAVERAKETQEARSEEVEEERIKLRETTRQRLESAREMAGDARQALTDQREALKAALHREGESNSVEIKGLASQLSEQLKELKDRRGQITKDRDAQCAEYDADLVAALTKKGIDASVMTDLQAAIEAAEKSIESIRRDAKAVQAWHHFVEVDLARVPNLKADLKIKTLSLETKQREEKKLKDDWAERHGILKTQVDAANIAIRHLNENIEVITGRLRDYDTNEIPGLPVMHSLDELVADLNDAQGHRTKLEKEIREGVQSVTRVFNRQVNSPAAQHLAQSRETFGSTVESYEWVPALAEWFDTLHVQHREALMSDARIMANSIKNGHQRLLGLDKDIRDENRNLQRSLSNNNQIEAIEEIGISITSSIKSLEFMPAMKKLSDLHTAWMNSGATLPPEGFADAMSNLLNFWNGKEGITANLRNQICIEGYIIEKGNRRDFHANTDLKEISSNGVSYLILTIILVGFINMVRGDQRTHMVWALDELGDIDPGNTRILLNMLRENDITLVAATPSAEAAVRDRFDYRVRVIKGPHLADIKGAAQPSQRLLASPAAEAELKAVEAEAQVVEQDGESADDEVAADAQLAASANQAYFAALAATPATPAQGE